MEEFDFFKYLQDKYNFGELDDYDDKVEDNNGNIIYMRDTQSILFWRGDEWVMIDKWPKDVIEAEEVMDHFTGRGTFIMDD